jgi:hypothetical protein
MTWTFLFIGAVFIGALSHWRSTCELRHLHVVYGRRMADATRRVAKQASIETTVNERQRSLQRQ